MLTLSKTGNSELDEQHSVMQDCLSELADLLDGACDPAALLGSLEALHSYAEWHFTFEERQLERAKYPNLAEHAAEHRAIVGHLDNLRRKLGTGNKDAASLISMIAHWIVDHIENEDCRSARYLGSAQAGTPQHERGQPAEPPRF